MLRQFEFSIEQIENINWLTLLQYILLKKTKVV